MSIYAGSATSVVVIVSARHHLVLSEAECLVMPRSWGRLKRAAFAAVVVAASLSGCTAAAPGPIDSSNSGVGEQAIADNLEFIAQRYNLDPPPEVAVVRRTMPSEWASVLADCLTSAGFEVSARSDGGVDMSKVPNEQQSSQAFGEVFYICNAQYPIDNRYYEPLTPSQLKELYVYLSEVLPGCMSQLGLEAAPLPSLTVFSETYGTADQYYAYATLPASIAEAEYLDLNANCPPQPPGDVLYD